MITLDDQLSAALKQASSRRNEIGRRRKKTMFWKILTLIALALLTWPIVAMGFDMMGEASNVLLVFGIAILFAVVIVWYLLITKTELVRGLFTTGLIALLFTTGCATRVEVGHVGIKVHYAGDDRGVEDYPMVTGWVPYMPGSSTVLEYPTYVQTATWASKGDGDDWRPHEQMCFNSKETMEVCGDISLSYRLAPDQIPEFYVQFRSDDLDKFTHGFMRNVARDAFNEEGSKMPLEQIAGEQKEQFITAVRARINTQVNPYGVHLEQFGFIGAQRLPPKFVEAVNAKLTATQNAIRVENELREAEAAAKKKVAAAQGEAESNRVRNASITPEMIRWKQLEILEKWDGRFPQVVAGGSDSMPLLLQLSATTN